MNRSTYDYQNILNMYGFNSLITIPTRTIIPLIDHIFTEIMFPVNSFKSGAFFKNIVDHFPVFCVLQNLRIESTNQFILKSSFTQNIFKFNDKFTELNWNNIHSEIALDECFSFYESFRKIFNLYVFQSRNIKLNIK